MKSLKVCNAILLAFPIIAFAGNLPSQQTSCPGKKCTATKQPGKDPAAPPGFTITPGTPKDGKGNATVVEGQLVPNCDDCMSCTRKLTWSFSGIAYSIRHGDDYFSSAGPGMGVVVLTVPCNDPLDSATFTAAWGPDATFSLTCPCQ